MDYLMKKLIFLFSLLLSSPALSDIETDKYAGTCSAYLMISKNANGANAAMNMADNTNRATQFGLNWINQLKRYKDDKTMVTGLVYEASSACRKVGIRPADFK